MLTESLYHDLASDLGRHQWLCNGEKAKSLLGKYQRGPATQSSFCLQGLIAFSRVGVYIRLPGVDVDAFAQHMQGGGLLSYIDTLSGGSVSRVGIFSLGKASLVQKRI